MLLDFVGPLNTGLATGGAGVATANKTGTVPIRGKLLGFQVRYNDSPPATTDVTIEVTGGALPTRTLLTLTNLTADGFFPVRAGAITPVNVAITNSFVPLPLIDDKIKVTIAQANDNDSVDVWAVVER